MVPVHRTRSEDLPVSLASKESNPALDFLTVDAITLHDARITRVMSVKGGTKPAVREMPFGGFRAEPSVVSFAGGKGAWALCS